MWNPFEPRQRERRKEGMKEEELFSLCTTSQAPARRRSSCGVAMWAREGKGEFHRNPSARRIRSGQSQVRFEIQSLCVPSGETNFLNLVSKGVTRHTRRGERGTMNASRRASRVGLETAREGFIPASLHAIWAQSEVHRLRGCGSTQSRRPSKVGSRRLPVPHINRDSKNKSNAACI